MLCALLYVLLKPVSKTLSLVAAFARADNDHSAGHQPAQSFFAQPLLKRCWLLTVFAPDQLQALVLLFLNAHESVVLIWGSAFALHLFVSGYLVYKSAYLPKWVGGLLVIAA